MAEDSVESNSPKKSDEHIGFANFDRILVAYDGTEMSKRALSYAAYFSKVSHSEILLINVLKADRHLKNLLPLTIKANLEEKEEEQIETVESQRRFLLDEPLREVVEEMRTACKAAGVTKNIIYGIRMGNPADEIINVSNLMHFDLIIMGSRRISSRIEAIGSTTRRVLTKVKAPLLIVQKQPTYKDEY
jgi:nucleotide-binding universal stress UspA family protein